MLKLKTTLLYLTLVCFSFGCKEAYKEHPNVKGMLYDKLPIDSIDMNGKVIPIADRHFDSVTFGSDTSNITLAIWDCINFKAKKPYSLIQWSDGTYGVLYVLDNSNWYKVINEKTGHHFTDVIEQGEHFPDSCSAKQNLKQFLDTRITYKIVK